MERFNILVLAGLTLAARCAPMPPAPAPVPPSATCATVCHHWAEMSCNEAKGTPGGESCVDVCRNIQNSGVFEWNLECISTVKVCSAIDKCEHK